MNRPKHKVTLTMPTIAIEMEMTLRAYVFVEVPPEKDVDDITDAMIVTACDQQLVPIDTGSWEVKKFSALGSCEYAPPADSGIIIHKPFANRPTMAERADHIGIAEGTLYRWRREGVDIFDDDQVRQKISTSRRWIPGLSQAFRVRLSGT